MWLDREVNHDVPLLGVSDVAGGLNHDRFSLELDWSWIRVCEKKGDERSENVSLYIHFKKSVIKLIFLTISTCSLYFINHLN